MPTSYNIHVGVAETSQTADQINDDMRNAVMPVTVIVGIEIVLGFFGNLLVLYVFWFRYHNCNFRYFVLYLALTDFTSTITTMPGEIVTQLFWYVYPVPRVCSAKSFFNVLTVSSEALCLMTIAVDRWRKICHPHAWQIKHRIAKWLWAAIYGSAILVAIPYSFLWGTHDEEYGDTNVTVTLCEIDANYKGTNIPVGYSSFFAAFIGALMLFMLILYILIARELIHDPGRNSRIRLAYSRPADDPPNRVTSPVDSDTNQDGDYSGGSHSREVSERNSRPSGMRRKTLIMVILTLIFIVTTILYTILLSLIANGILRNMTDKGRAAYFFFFRLYFINHVINPFVYLGLDSTFRKAITKCNKPAAESRSSST